MDRKLKIILPALIVVILVAVIVFSVGNTTSNTINTQNNSSDNKGLSLVGNTTISGSSQVSDNGISLEELAKHNSETDCWVTYKSKVYDLTTWIDKHPGGKEAILNQCGTDKFEEAFKKQHGDSKATLFIQVAKLIGDVEVKGNLN